MFLGSSVLVIIAAWLEYATKGLDQNGGDALEVYNVFLFPEVGHRALKKVTLEMRAKK